MPINLVEHWNRSNESIIKKSSRYAEDIESKFPRNSQICDLGGGTGSDSLFFAEQGHDVTLVDISDLALSRARERSDSSHSSSSLQLVQADLGNPLPFKSGSFDVVYSRLGLHFFDFNTTAKVFEEIKRVLKPGGWAYLTMKSPNDTEEMNFFKNHTTELGENVFDDLGIIKSRFDSKQLSEILVKAGINQFEVNEIHEKLREEDIVRSGNREFILNEIVFTK